MRGVISEWSTPWVHRTRYCDMDFHSMVHGNSEKKNEHISASHTRMNAHYDIKLLIFSGSCP